MSREVPVRVPEGLAGKSAGQLSSLRTVAVRSKPNCSKRRLDGGCHSVGWNSILKRQRLSIVRVEIGRGVTRMRALTFSGIRFDHGEPRVGLDITL